jgi:Uma2 family endonuclease
MAIGTTRATPTGPAQSPLAITSSVASAPDPDEAVTLDSLYRLSVAQYHAMVRAGVLTEEDPVELLEGLLVCKMSKNPPHVVATELLQRALSRLVPEGWYVSMQNPVTTKSSEPEPDAKIVKGHPRDYLKRQPGPRKVPLAIEVADNSLKRDRTFKKRIYAAARIPTYWIINLVDRCVEVYTDPTGPTSGPKTKPDYRKSQIVGPGESLVITLDGHEVGPIAVSELLP